MIFPDLKSIGFGMRSHGSVLRLLAFFYCDPKMIKEADSKLNKRQLLKISLAIYLHSLPYLIIVIIAGRGVLSGLMNQYTIYSFNNTEFTIVFFVLFFFFYCTCSIMGGFVTGFFFIIYCSLSVGITGSLDNEFSWFVRSFVGGICFSLLVSGYLTKLSNILFTGLMLGITAGVFVGIDVGLFSGFIAGIVCLGGYLIGSLRPYYLPWHFLLLITKNLVFFRRYHPVFWDQAFRVPFPFLHKLLIMYAEKNRVDGDIQIELLISNKTHRQEALRAKTILIAQRSARVEELADLSVILAQLPEGEKGYLAQTASIRDRAMAVYRQQIYLDNADRPFFREQAAHQLRAEINGFSAHVAGFHEPLASEFRRAAEAWLVIADRQLVEAENQRGREQTPQLFRAGDPVRLDTEAFVERCEVIGALEHEIMAGPGCPGVLLYGRRRMGKSTIIRNLDGFLPEMVKTVVISMQNPAAFASESSLAGHLHEEIGKVYTGGTRPSQPPEGLSGIYEFFSGLDGTLARNGHRLLLCLDEFEEIDRCIGNGAFSPDLPAMLRESVQNHRRITWLFAGRHHFTELRNVRWSSYLVSLRTIEVPPFTQQETHLLLTEPLKYSRNTKAQEAGKFYGPHFWGEGGVERIHRETGGWPHLVQLVASTVVDICNRKGFDQASPGVLEQAFAAAVVSGETVLTELMLYKSDEHEAAWRYLAGFRKADSQPPPEDDDVRLLLKRHLLAQETAEGNWTLRIPLMLRWLKERT